MTVVFEHAEGQAARVAATAESAGLADVMPATPVGNDEIRIDRAAVDRHPVEVADAVRIGDERHGPAVGGDLRAQVLAAQERRESGARRASPDRDAPAAARPGSSVVEIRA